MKWFILVTVLALLAFGLLAGLVLTAWGVGAEPVGRAGVGLSADARWVTVVAYYSERDRGTAVHDPAWVDGDASRGAPGVHTVQLASVPNVIGRARLAVIAVRTVGDAAYTVARHLLAAGAADGGTDADRR